jgi:hypothetical protein
MKELKNLLKQPMEHIKGVGVNVMEWHVLNGVLDVMLDAPSLTDVVDTVRQIGIVQPVREKFRSKWNIQIPDTSFETLNDMREFFGFLHIYLQETPFELTTRDQQTSTELDSAIVSYINKIIEKLNCKSKIIFYSESLKGNSMVIWLLHPLEIQFGIHSECLHTDTGTKTTLTTPLLGVIEEMFDCLETACVELKKIHRTSKDTKSPAGAARGT